MKSRSDKLARHRGVALLTALVIVGIASVLVTGMLWDVNLDVRRTGNLLAANQAYAYALGAEDWVAHILRRDHEKEPGLDHLGEPWAAELPPLPVEGGQIEGRIVDLQGRFNVNNLVLTDVADPNQAADQLAKAREIFENLLQTLGLDPALANAVHDWLDEDIDPRFPGAEDDLYIGKTPPYRAANGPIASISELRLVEGVTGEVYTLLAPHITALPVRTPVNINTATDKVLIAVSRDAALSEAEALAILAQRIEQPYRSTQEFVTEHPVERADAISVASSWFRLESYVTIGNVTLPLYSLLARSQGGDTRAVTRSFGTE